MFKLSKAFLKKLVLVVLGLIAACQPFLVAASVGYSLVVVHRLLIAAASLVAGAEDSRHAGFRSWGSQA